MILRKKEAEEHCMGNWEKVGHYNNCDCYGSYNSACMSKFIFFKKIVNPSAMHFIIVLESTRTNFIFSSHFIFLPKKEAIEFYVSYKNKKS